MKNIQDTDISGKKVFLRCDLNVSLNEKGEIRDDFRILVSLPTIKELLAKRVKLIIASHLGRPEGRDLRYSLEGVAKKLSGFLGRDVKFIPEIIGDAVRKAAEGLGEGEIMMLENLRFDPREQSNDREFARELASLADIFVNDAFGVSHRSHASIVGIPKILPSCAGLLLEKELKILSRITTEAERPFAVIIGGAKISTKIFFIKELIKKVNHILLGGALANTILHAQGIGIGKSYIEKNMVLAVNDFQITDVKMHLPVDAITSKDKTGKEAINISPIGKIREDELILDIGPDTVALYKEVINDSRTVIWNGPMGLMEVEQFAHGTEQIAKIIADSGAFSVIGGGESVDYVNKLNLRNKFSHVSSGGGTMLEFLAGQKLPGVEALK